jgi:large subunit ribosomal protein L23
MSTSYDIIRRPVITEKGLTLKEQDKTLCFEVSNRATKTQIKEAIERIFKVKVEHVRTMNVPGKERRRGKFTGYRPDWKKAYVTLRDGEKMIEYGEAV